MGEITDGLRANLRVLAQSDARLLRELDAALPAGSASAETIPAATSAPAGGVAAGSVVAGSVAAGSVARLDDGLERLSLKELKELCKQRRLKGITKLKKDELIALLRGGGSSSPAGLPAVGRSTAGAAELSAAGGGDRLASLEARLDRMEQLLQRIAGHLGVG